MKSIDSHNSDAAVYPWQKETWNQLIKRAKGKSIPHAILLTGPMGNGKFHFARSFAKYLLCSNLNDQDLACGVCQSCYWFDNNSHPDLNEVLPTGKSETIKVDQIRELCSHLSLTSHSGGFQIGLIYPVEKMNLNAANSLLKSLEEPTGNSIYILVSHEPGQLPATIRSRCQQLTMLAPEPGLGAHWMEQQGIENSAAISDLLAITSAPLAALKLHQQQELQKRLQIAQELLAVIEQQTSLVSTAEKWAKENIKVINVWLLSWVSDMIKARFDSVNAYQHNPDVQNMLQRLNNLLNLTLLFSVHNQLMQTNKTLVRSANHQMLAESILLSWIP